MMEGIAIRILLILCITLGITACSSVSDNSPEKNSDSEDVWLIPKEQVYPSTGRDAIASIEDPGFTPARDVEFLDRDELVIGLKIGDTIRAYPHVVLYRHEIVNDQYGEIPVSLTFCPLTGSGLAWKGLINGKETTFGVSGLIYKNNLIAYDRLTGSYWSQMKSLSVNGEMIGEEPDSYHLVEMTWGAWKEAFPNSHVLTRNGDRDARYKTYPYGGDYASNNNSILFPIEGEEDDRLERKALCHGIFFDSFPLVIPIDQFPARTKVINKLHFGNEVVIAGNSELQLAVSFSRVREDGTVLEFYATEADFPVIMEDQEGNLWNIFGEAVSGPRVGETLERIPSYNAFWFAWVDFFSRSPKDPQILFP